MCFWYKNAADICTIQVRIDACRTGTGFITAGVEWSGEKKDISIPALIT